MDGRQRGAEDGPDHDPGKNAEDQRQDEAQTKEDDERIARAPARLGKPFGRTSGFVALRQLQPLDEAAEQADMGVARGGPARRRDDGGAQLSAAAGVGADARRHRIVRQQAAAERHDRQESRETDGQRQHGLEAERRRQKAKAEGEPVGQGFAEVHISNLIIFMITAMPVPMLQAAPASSMLPACVVISVMT